MLTDILHAIIHKTFFYYIKSINNYAIKIVQLCVYIYIRVYVVSRDSVVGMATGCGLDDRGVGVRVPVGSRIFFSPRRPDLLRGLPSLVSNGYRGLFPRG
jgi:hypothetical protein